ncbi:MAG: DEAD/DEAH box helicase [Akkermansiaceae bacterium]
MSQHANLIKWLRECYRDDRARSGVSDFMSGKVLHRRIIKGNESLASRELPEIVLPPSYGERAAPHAALYRREQEVVYACLFLCGLHEGRPTRAPLVFYQAEFPAHNSAALTIEINRWRINPRALEILETDADTISNILRGGEMTEGVIGAIRDWAEQLGVDASALWQWPELVDRNTLNAAADNKTLSLHPAAGVAIIPRSISSRGVIDELDLIAAHPDEWSLPLRIMLGMEDMQELKQADDFMAVPALLSQSQERILKSSRNFPVTLCHGPPGTGKSFTIAAIALNHVARGESVLVASRMDHAVDVVQEKIDTMLGGDEVTVRAGRRDHLSKLKRYLESCLAGQMTTNVTTDTELRRQFSQVKATMSELHGDELKLEKEWSKALSRGEVMAKPNPNILEKIQRAWMKHRVKDRFLLLELTAHLNDLYVQREAQLGTYLRMQRKRLLKEALNSKETRRDFKTMLSALRKYRGSEQEQMFRSMRISSVLRALPVWLTTLDDLHRVLPMEKELFDVAIIDESSQCDLASVLPLMQRAKRIVVAGDTRQLRHMSFLARARQTTLAEELGVTAEQQEMFNYRDVSLMDHATAMVESQLQIGFLNEHFRSSPRIISFSNQRFYQNSLQVMRERPWENQDDALVSVSCDGKRDDHGVNDAEIDAIIRDLLILYHESRYLPDVSCPSAGILSPFRNQVEAIRERLQTELSQSELSRLLNVHRLLIGTAHTFQGEERDVMFLSFAVEPEVGSMTLRFVEREDVFNVSITRAKSMQRVYHSLKPSDLSSSSLLADYLSQLSADHGVMQSQSAGDAFMQEVAEALAQRDIKVLPCQRVAGVSVDLLLMKNGRALGLDLIGYPGESYAAIDLHRLKVLRRAGFRLLPLGYTEWTAQKSHAIESILHELEHDTRYQ